MVLGPRAVVGSLKQEHIRVHYQYPTADYPTLLSTRHEAEYRSMISQLVAYNSHDISDELLTFNYLTTMH
jgi:hypothetical protein